MPSSFRKKEGRYGTLYRYRIAYHHVSDADCEFVWYCWAYDTEHALDQFYDTPDDGWVVSGRPTRVQGKGVYK